MREVLKRVAAGEPMRRIARSYAVDHSTISRLKARQAADNGATGGFKSWA